MINQNLKKIKIALIVVLIALICFAIFYFLKNTKTEINDFKPLRDENGKIIIMTASFPVYDFAKEVGGDKVAVTLLLPPGLESHSFKPTEKEMAKVASSSLVFYNSFLAEPWLEDFSLSFGDNIKFIAVGDSLIEGNDPHVWLDFEKAGLMVDSIKEVYQSVDSVNYDYYQDQAEAYKQELISLDEQYSTTLQNCQFRNLVQGGHQAFAYLAKRYNLNYLSSHGPEPKTDMDINRFEEQVQNIKDSGQGYVFYEELIMPSLAEAIRQQTNAKMIMLNAAHNVGRFDIEGGLTFIKIMRNNLDSLKLALSCQ